MNGYRKMGVQMMLLKDKVEEAGIYAVLKEIYNIGYHTAEVSQIDMTAENIQEMQRAMHDFNMDNYPGKGMEQLYFMLHMVTEFAEVGEGTLPMKEIIETGLDSDSEFFFVEQDELYGKDPYDCLITSRNNLIDIGYEI